MGQDVFVLDPLGHSGVDEKYLAYFDPLSALDPEDKDGELATWAKRIANSLIEISENTESGEWAKRAVRLIALIIMHVVTSDRFPKEEKNLITVLRLLMEGDQELHSELMKAYPEKNIPDAVTLLFEDMTENKACRGWIASDARNLLQQMKGILKFFESVRGEAADKLDWFKSAGIERSLKGWGDESRHFDPTRLKTDPKGISVFIVMPVEDLKTYGPWVQTIFIGIFAAMRKIRGEPESGHQVLTILDEFSSLGYQEYISSSLDNIAGAGMKLAIIVQNFGKLKKLYGEEMESFFTNAGLEIYFGKIGETAEEYLKKQLGETEIVRLAKSKNISQSHAESLSEAVAYGTTSSSGETETHTDSQSKAQSRGQNWNWSKATNWSDTKNWGESNGETMGRNYGPHIFWQGFTHTNNYGTSLNKNRGNAHTSGGAKTRGGGGSKQFTDTQSQSQAIGSSWQEGNSYTETSTKGTTETYQIGEGIAETFHKKPLLDAHEINSFLCPLEFDDRDHPAYPGLALVRIQGEHPFFVRRSHYDQDPYFELCFSKDPVHGFLPLSELPLLGYQYTEEHVFPIKFPALLHESGYQAETLLRPHQRFEKAAEIFKYKDDLQNIHISARSPFSGRVANIANLEEQKKDGSIVTIKADIPLNDNDRLAFKREIFEKALKKKKRLGLERKQREEENKIIRMGKNIAFHFNEDGTVTDLKNNLVWKQAPYGVEWNGNQFCGVPKKLSWFAAIELFGRGEFIDAFDKDGSRIFDNKELIRKSSIQEKKFIQETSGWRLPTVAEWHSIMFEKDQSYNEDAHLRIFPYKNSGRYWTATGRCETIYKNIFAKCISYIVLKSYHFAIAWAASFHEIIDLGAEEEMLVLLVKNA